MPPDPDTRVGVPISSEQAALAVLRRIKSPVLGDVNVGSIGHNLARAASDEIFSLLSGGEQKLVRIAQAVYNGSEVAPISYLGGLDRATRRYVLSVLVYFYLASDLSIIELDEDGFAIAFGPR